MSGAYLDCPHSDVQVYDAANRQPDEDSARSTSAGVPAVRRLVLGSSAPTIPLLTSETFVEWKDSVT